MRIFGVVAVYVYGVAVVVVQTHTRSHPYCSALVGKHAVDGYLRQSVGGSQVVEVYVLCVCRQTAHYIYK